MIARRGMWVLGVVAFVCTTDLLKMGNTLHPDPDLLVNCARFRNIEPLVLRVFWGRFLVLRGNSEAQFELRGSAQGLVSNSDAHLLKSSHNSQTKRLRGFSEPLVSTFIKAALK